MPRIFISYRRDDSIAITGRIYDRLEDAFDSENVFQDVDDMPFGVDFRQHLQEQIAQCDVVLVIIGPQWVKIADNSGRRRLDNPADFVRIEVENGLKQNKLVIPVLVDDAAMPDESDLPESLRDLCYRNAATVRHNPDFRRDMARLVDQIERYFKNAISVGAQRTAPTQTPTLESAFTPPDVSHILPPPFEWCYVPRGFVTLEDASNRKPPGTKGGKFEVSDFYIAKYPITNKQYQTFVNARDGWQRLYWWEYSDEAMRWREKQPNQMNYSLFADNCPCVNINWYESLAFCWWLNSHLSQITSQITLPTEQQWQYAAQGDKGWKYPWGNNFDSQLCNTSESNINKPTPVTQYSNGMGTYGVFDMSGNVWEWCLTIWGTDKNDLGSDMPRVVRGGSWNRNSLAARSTTRRRSKPTFKGSGQGFRIVCISL